MLRLVHEKSERAALPESGFKREAKSRSALQPALNGHLTAASIFRLRSLNFVADQWLVERVQGVKIIIAPVEVAPLGRNRFHAEDWNPTRVGPYMKTISSPAGSRIASRSSCATSCKRE